MCQPIDGGEPAGSMRGVRRAGCGELSVGWGEPVAGQWGLTRLGEESSRGEVLASEDSGVRVAMGPVAQARPVEAPACRRGFGERPRPTGGTTRRSVPPIRDVSGVLRGNGPHGGGVSVTGARAGLPAGSERGVRWCPHHRSVQAGIRVGSVFRRVRMTRHHALSAGRRRSASATRHHSQSAGRRRSASEARRRSASAARHRPTSTALQVSARGSERRQASITAPQIPHVSY